MQLNFSHPTQNYTFIFELLSDFYIDTKDDDTKIILPKCKILNWQFNDVEFGISGITNLIL